MGVKTKIFSAHRPITSIFVIMILAITLPLVFAKTGSNGPEVTNNIIICVEGVKSRYFFDDDGNEVDDASLKSILTEFLNDNLAPKISNSIYGFDGRYIYYSNREPMTYGYGSLNRFDVLDKKKTVLIPGEAGGHYGISYDGAKLSPTLNHVAALVGNGTGWIVVYDLKKGKIVFKSRQESYYAHWSSDGRILSAGNHFYDFFSQREIKWPSTILPHDEWVESILEKDTLYWVYPTEKSTLYKFKRDIDSKPIKVFEHPLEKGKYGGVFLVGVTTSGLLFRTKQSLFKLQTDGSIKKLGEKSNVTEIANATIYYLGGK